MQLKSVKCMMFCVAAGSFSGGAVADVPIKSSTFGGLRARAIGPAVMGGRISALDAVMEKRLTLYVGAAGGGAKRHRGRHERLRTGLPGRGPTPSFENAYQLA